MITRRPVSRRLQRGLQRRRDRPRDPQVRGLLSSTLRAPCGELIVLALRADLQEAPHNAQSSRADGLRVAQRRGTRTPRLDGSGGRCLSRYVSRKTAGLCAHELYKRGVPLCVAQATRALRAHGQEEAGSALRRAPAAQSGKDVKTNQGMVQHRTARVAPCKNEVAVRYKRTEGRMQESTAKLTCVHW